MNISKLISRDIKTCLQIDKVPSLLKVLDPSSKFTGQKLNIVNIWHEIHDPNLSQEYVRPTDYFYELDREVRHS